MPFNFTTPTTISQTVAGYEINSFAVDMDRGELVIGYDQLNDLGQPIGQEKVLVVDGPDFAPAISRVSEIAGADVYAALKQGMYEQIQTLTGVSGTVV